MTKAVLLIKERVDYPDGAFVEMVVWTLPLPIPASKHRFKYRMVYIVDGKRIIGYDNERGKGDHRHIGTREENYRFTSIENLIAGFFTDIRAARGET